MRHGDLVDDIPWQLEFDLCETLSSSLSWRGCFNLSAPKTRKIPSSVFGSARREPKAGEGSASDEPEPSGGEDERGHEKGVDERGQ